MDYLAPEPRAAEDGGATASADVQEAAAKLATRDHYEVLEVPRDATQPAIMAAYYRQAKRFHPDGHQPRACPTCARSSTPCSGA